MAESLDPEHPDHKPIQMSCEEDGDETPVGLGDDEEEEERPFEIVCDERTFTVHRDALRLVGWYTDMKDFCAIRRVDDNAPSPEEFKDRDMHRCDLRKLGSPTSLEAVEKMVEWLNHHATVEPEIPPESTADGWNMHEWYSQFFADTGYSSILHFHIIGLADYLNIRALYQQEAWLIAKNIIDDKDDPHKTLRGIRMTDEQILEVEEKKRRKWERDIIEEMENANNCPLADNDDEKEEEKQQGKRKRPDSTAMDVGGDSDDEDEEEKKKEEDGEEKQKQKKQKKQHNLRRRKPSEKKKQT